MTRHRLLLDASCVIALARLDAIESAHDLVGDLYITPEVQSEATVGGRPGAEAVAAAIERGIVVVLEMDEVEPLPGLGPGETSTIRRAPAEGMTAVIDDLDARRTAERLGVSLTGTVAILVRLSADGALAIDEALDRLDEIGFRVSPAVRAWALARPRS